MKLPYNDVMQKMPRLMHRLPLEEAYIKISGISDRMRRNYQVVSFNALFIYRVRHKSRPIRLCIPYGCANSQIEIGN